jgi:uncharacterized membrane-anchored protein
MSFRKPPVIASSLALLAALSLLPSQGWAWESRRGGEAAAQEIAPLEVEEDHEIIVELPPMRPVKKRAAAETSKPAPKSAERKEAAEPGPAPVAEAPKPIETLPVVPAPATEARTAAESAKPAEPSVPAQPPASVAQSVADEQKTAPSAPEVQPQPTARSVAAEPVGAAPESAEPQKPVAAREVPPAPAQPAQKVEPRKAETAAAPRLPLLTGNPPRKALADLKAPTRALDQKPLLPQDAAFVAPALVPQLQSLAKAEPQPAPVAEAVPTPEKSVEAAAAPASLSPETQAASEAPSMKEATAQQETAAPAEPVASAEATAADAQADASIAALLAEGVAGPAEVRIADHATLSLPAGRVFLPIEPARKLAREAGLEWRPGVQGVIAPAGDRLQWLAPIELLDDGHIGAGEADALDPEKLIAAFRAGLPQVNAERSRAGQPPVTIDGWLSAPALTKKHRLSACANLSTRTDQNGADSYFNCEAWALGRHGALKVELAEGAEAAEKLKDEAMALADAIVFDSGRGYEDFDPATDKAAPYTAADMVTRDVSAQTAPAPAEAAAPAPAESGLLSRLLEPALLAVAALALYVWMKRRRKETDAPEGAAAAPVSATEPVPAGEAPSSLFARLLPTLHARFAKGDAKAPPAKEIAASPAPVAERIEEKPAVAAPASLFARLLPTLHARLSKSKAPKVETAPASTVAPEAKQAQAAASLFARLLPTLHARFAKGAAESAAKAKAPVVAAGAAGKAEAGASRKTGGAPANDAEEPISALRRLAAMMRRSSEEPATPPVDVSRAMRTLRRLPGAAPAVAEVLPEPYEATVVTEVAQQPSSAPMATVVAEPVVTKPAPMAAAAKPESEPVGVIDLVEPGDAEAATAAINAARALREAQG